VFLPWCPPPLLYGKLSGMPIGPPTGTCILARRDFFGTPSGLRVNPPAFSMVRHEMHPRTRPRMHTVTDSSLNWIQVGFAPSGAFLALGVTSMVS
jgi:hypothetical protein